jgi:light-regulated signal transduction histidine kinase (bacteriophytochrome)
MIKITNDVFDIAKRIKELDAGYEIFYMTTKNRFEVYKEGERMSVLPFDKLDARTVEYLRETRIENQQRLLEKIDRHNEMLRQNAERQEAEISAYKIKNMVNYLNKNTDYVPCYDEI